MKHILDLTVVSNQIIGGRYAHLRLTDEREPLPEPILPGQFVQVRIDDTPSVLLRRPISINQVDRRLNQLWLLVAIVGDGTRWIASRRPGDRLNCVLPLGNGFSIGANASIDANASIGANASERWKNGLQTLGGVCSYLLVGGGVGVAPLLYLASELKGNSVAILLGARTKADLLLREEFEKYGNVHVTTEDGSDGTRGFVTNDSYLTDCHFDRIQCCGPTPMMKAVARVASQYDIDCEVSLENQMACGLGACLCCVENTKEGNLCVCTEGPVFNTKRLLWQD